MIRVFTAFSGYDSQALALKRLGVPFELTGWSEINKSAIRAHNALFPNCTDNNYGDICQIDWDSVPDFDLFTYSSPCQDFSKAGLRKGGQIDSNTRSSLLWQCGRAIESKRPKFLLFENVPNVVSKTFVDTFNEWQLTLEKLGYSNHCMTLNSMDYGIPQNRERLFMVSIRDGGSFHFPKPEPLTRFVSDFMDEHVDEKYYLPEAWFDRLCQHDPQGDLLRVRQATFKGYTEVSKNGIFDRAYPKSPYRRGRVQGEYGNICPTITCHCEKNLVYVDSEWRKRTLTERECFRLMGLRDSEIDQILTAGISKTQLYTMAGNSIVVDVLERIFDRMFFHPEPARGELLTIFDAL